MDCDKINELLPWYVNGSLKGGEKQKVEQHLKVCSRCQKELAQAKWLLEGVKKYGDVLLTGHIDSEKLVLYAQSPQELKEIDRSLIESHLKSCSDCSEELRLLRESRKELKKTSVPMKGRISLGNQVTDWIKGFLGGLSWLVRRPAFAYLLLLLLIYPAYIGLFGTRPKELDENVILRGQELMLREQIRGVASRIPQVSLGPSTNVLHLKIPYPIDTTFSVNYELGITDSTGSVIWMDRDWQRYDIEGEERFWILDLNTTVLPSGLLEVHIREHEPGQVSEMPASIYQFRLIKK